MYWQYLSEKHIETYWSLSQKHEYPHLAELYLMFILETLLRSSLSPFENPASAPGTTANPTHNVADRRAMWPELKTL